MLAGRIAMLEADTYEPLNVLRCSDDLLLHLGHASGDAVVDEASTLRATMPHNHR